MAATAAGKPKEENVELWMYVDATTGQQRGPLSEKMLKRLIRRGLVQPQQLVWTKRLTEWQPVMHVSPLDQYCNVWSASWFYIADTATRKQLGPVNTKALLALFVDGDIDGLTLVWRPEMTKWRPIAEVPELKEFVREVNEDQAREERAMETQQHVAKNDQVYTETVTDAFVAEDGKEYVFDAETKKFVTPQDKIEDDLAAFREQLAEEDPQRHRQAARGDAKKPTPPAVPVSKVDDDVLATLASESTNNDVDSKNENDTDGTVKTEEEAKQRKKRKKKKSEKWRKAKVNTWVYVSGLPLDVTVEEVHQHFLKCGIIQTDVTTGEPRIKLYKNKDYGGLNGDASVCYMKDASVDLAVQLLDKSNIRPEWTIDVAPAVFEQKGEQFVKPKKPRITTQARVQLIEQEKALSWTEAEDGDRTGLRIVVLQHLFVPEEMKDEQHVNELHDDILQECSLLGEVIKVTVFRKHQDGIVIVKFAASGSATQCIERMNGRYFAGRQLECHFWDGTDYTYKESTEEQKHRSDEFNEWLNEGSSSGEDEEPTEVADAPKHEASDDAVEGIHAGRVMPSLDDSDEEDSD